MNEYASWIISIISIIVCISTLRRRGTGGNRRNTPVRRGQGQQRQRRTNEPMQTGEIVYFASDSYGLPSREYHFDYRKVQGSWRVYILKMPPLNGRSGASSITHRLTDGAMYFICWDRPIRTLDGAQTVSRTWADNIQRYIATGQRF